MEKERRCLKCGEMFKSKGPQNRICPSCWTKNKYYHETIRSDKIVKEDKFRKMSTVTQENI